MIPFIARYVACVTHRRLYCKQFNVFGRFVDIILFKTVAKYVAGRLIRTSFGLFQDLASVFISRYVAWVTHNSLYCIYFNLFGRYVEVNLFKIFAKDVRILLTTLQDVI